MPAMRDESAQGDSAFHPLSRFDGKYLIGADGTRLFQLSNYLGGGSSGVVYSASSCYTPSPSSPLPLACKILNPVGYRLLPPSVIGTYLVVSEGSPVASVPHPSTGLPSLPPLTTANVTWVTSRAPLAQPPSPP
ncbi:hypothetical protein TeGR_g9401, partial [Tetraparma gracilis]